MNFIEKILKVHTIPSLLAFYFENNWNAKKALQCDDNVIVLEIKLTEIEWLCATESYFLNFLLYKQAYWHSERFNKKKLSALVFTFAHPANSAFRVTPNYQTKRVFFSARSMTAASPFVLRGFILKYRNTVHVLFFLLIIRVDSWILNRSLAVHFLIVFIAHFMDD